MEFEWDEPKRARVLRERGIDFVRMAEALFDGRPVVTIASPRGVEERFITIGSSEGRGFAVVWTWRGATVRIITARRARDDEARRYRSLFG
jgi:uncharacterized DUF497 family protein